MGEAGVDGAGGKRRGCGHGAREGNGALGRLGRLGLGGDRSVQVRAEVGGVSVVAGLSMATVSVGAEGAQPGGYRGRGGHLLDRR